MTWLLVAAPAVLGAEIAHAVAETLAGRAGSPTELFSNTHAPGLSLGLAALGAALLLGFGARAARARSGPSGTRVAWWHMVVFALVLYVVQEHVELALAGRPWWATSFTAAFATGVAVQLPFALTAYLLYRALSSAADGIGRLAARPPRRPLAADLFRRQALPRVALVRRALYASVRPSRGPPLPAL
jgi:hypothetical protein